MQQTMTMLDKYQKLITEMSDSNTFTKDNSESALTIVLNPETELSLNEMGSILQIEMFEVGQHFREPLCKWEFLKDETPEKIMLKIDEDLNSLEEDIFKDTREEIRTGYGSIGEAARTFAGAYMKYERDRIKDVEVFARRFTNVLNERIQIFESQQPTEQGMDALKIRMKNKLVLFRQDSMKQICSYIDMPTSFGGRINESTLNALKLDLPTVITYAMLMESPYYRDKINAADDEILRLCLEVIHQEVSSVCSFQLMFSEEDFVDLNTINVQMLLNLLR